MKNLGLLILTVGVALSAAYGARLGSEMQAQSAVKGRAELLEAAERGAFRRYCKSREEAGLPLRRPAPPDASTIDGCPDPSARPRPVPDSREEPTRAELVASGRARLAGLRGGDEPLPDAVRAKRLAWLRALEASIEPGAVAAVVEAPKPQARLAQWFGESGALFLCGLFLVVVGAVIGRVAVRREATGGGDGRTAGEAQDFGALLAELRDLVIELAEGMDEEDQPERHERLKDELHRLTLDKFEPLVDARARVQAKYGMAGFADIFGPLSSAERHVNRAWSALVDDHWPEARASVLRAADDLRAAHDQLTSLMSR
jgi:hypothetical protein